MSDTDPNWPNDGADGGDAGGGATPPPPPPAPPAGGAAVPPAPAGAGHGRQRAEFGQRAVALLLDYVIGFGLFLAVAIVAAVLSVVSDALGGLFALLGYLGVIVFTIGMYILGEGGPLGQTPGKHMQGIQVVKNDGSALTMGDAALRYVGRILDTIVCGLPIGYLWPLFDEQDRTWHDMVASTTVVTGGPKGSVGEWFKTFRA